MLIEIIISSLITGLVALIFFYLGKISERRKWNSLIKDKIIPEPGTKIKLLIDNNELNIEQRKAAIELLKKINPKLINYN